MFIHAAGSMPWIFQSIYSGNSWTKIVKLYTVWLKILAKKTHKREEFWETAGLVYMDLTQQVTLLALIDLLVLKY